MTPIFLVATAMKNHFLEMLDGELSPVLQADGFGGQEREWKRHHDPVINCVEVQLRSDQAACTVNLGAHLTFLPVAGGSSPVLFDTITEADCEIQSRLAWQSEPEHWWGFDSPEESVADLVACYREQGKAYFERFVNFPHPFVDIAPDNLDDDDVSTLFPIMTRVRKILLIARVHEHLGDAANAVRFAKLGKEVAGMAIGPKAAFRDILRRYK